MAISKMRKFRIAIVCPAFDRFIAGSFISTLRFAKLLSKKGHEIIVLSSKYPRDKDIEMIGEVKVYRLHSFCVPGTGKKLYLPYANRKRIREILIKEKTEIVHFMMPDLSAYSSARAAKKLGLKVAAHSHTTSENFVYLAPPYLKFLAGLTNFFAYKFLVGFYNHLSDVIICPTEFARKFILSKGLKKKTYVVSNGVDRRVFRRFDAKKYEKKFGLSKGTIKAFFVGRLDPEKNIPELIKSVPFVLEKFKNFEVCIVGGGYKTEQLENLVGEMNLGKTIKFLGRVSDEDLVRAYNFGDIFVLPSLVELEGMVVLEAIACGKPILIANSKGSAARFFVSKNGFLFDPKNEKDLAKKMLILLKDKKLRDKMGNVSYEMSKKFDINESVKKLEKIYSTLI